MTTTLTPPGPPPLSPGGRTAARAALVIAAVTVIAITLALLTAAAVGLSAFRLVTDHRGLPANMRALTVETASSPMAVRIVSDRDATTPRVDVRMVTTDRGDREELTVSTDAGGTLLRVDAPSSFLAWGDPGELTVTVPPELGRQLAVTVRQDNGVLIAEADLDELTATTTDGMVLLRGTVRRIEVRARDGEIHTRQPISVGEAFIAETRDGDVQVRFSDAPPTIEATTRDGDVDLALPTPGPYLVRAQSDDGSASVRVPQTTDSARAAATVTATTRDGEISVDTLRSIGR
ncbi:DUF4097 family beta strand repeat-containing protein [Mycolicibacterium frederiksbergense]|uniref:DUF4097 family beta strand repeat-containing protein n=1 Tax=Mycolicibacterium frederiksbergense TaxID=117567 RepID=UPI00265B7C50|nr:DUF4097 family beta strand repeat-containing protein [Mycolicibacterium frederiksbergense]MDO0975524.1 DUF4097 family beta strand repeat-containing protein [Mycolicibacterium frederiksbergense]